MSCPVSVYGKLVQQACFLNPCPYEEGVRQVVLAQAPFGHQVALLEATFEPAQTAVIVQGLDTAWHGLAISCQHLVVCQHLDVWQLQLLLKLSDFVKAAIHLILPAAHD